MRHLSSEELLDIADGTAEAGVHLTECESCRAELREVRATLAEVRAVDVPEPSPLFWDHFSARVQRAIEADGASSAAGKGWWSWHFVVPIASVAVLALVAALTLSNRGGSAPSTPGNPSASAAISPATTDDTAPMTLDESPSFDVVADLTSGIDLDTVREAGLLELGAADHAVTHMNDDELRELAKLLRAEIAPVKGVRPS